MSEDGWYDYDEPDGIICPRCQGAGTVDCHCGGDLCICENYGERDCPVCGGDGEVSEEVEAKYEESRRSAHEAMRRVFDGSPKDSTQ